MYRVLIADDEEIERLSFSRKLKKYFGESCEVFQAENGRSNGQSIQISRIREIHGELVDYMDDAII